MREESATNRTHGGRRGERPRARARASRPAEGRRRRRSHAHATRARRLRTEEARAGSGRAEGRGTSDRARAASWPKEGRRRRHSHAPTARALRSRVKGISRVEVGRAESQKARVFGGAVLGDRRPLAALRPPRDSSQQGLVRFKARGPFVPCESPGGSGRRAQAGPLSSLHWLYFFFLLLSFSTLPHWALRMRMRWGSRGAFFALAFCFGLISNGAQRVQR